VSFVETAAALAAVGSEIKPAVRAVTDASATSFSPTLPTLSFELIFTYPFS
jgi:hypothetical protein